MDFFLIKSIFDSSLPLTCNSIHVPMCCEQHEKTGNSIMFHILKKITTVHLQLSASAACSFSFPTCTKTWYQITRMSVCKLSSMVLYGSLLYFVNTRSATSSASANQCTKLRNPANIFYSLQQIILMYRTHSQWSFKFFTAILQIYWNAIFHQ